MRRLVGILVMVVFVMAGSVCFAQVPNDRVAIGGITPGASIDYVRSVYGAPSKSHSGQHALWAGTVEEYQYGDSLFVTFRNGKVVQVRITKNNGLATPDGVTVGMKASVLSNVYGKADRVYNKQNYVYNPETSHELLFKTQNGKIVFIGCGSFD